MPKKARGRHPSKARAAPSWQRRRLLLGGAILLAVLGAVALARHLQQRAVAPKLQGAIANHYTWGTPGAPVVVKEFFDYT
ncbi:MAG: hypothetical protein KatS3mg131_0167 [Candidatus Tectimicrobiota bacterium]|nr:MAG: hypothetical protein KatS3mg131_0167 [Candidatus Tectomicrobia bacterium]